MKVILELTLIYIKKKNTIMNEIFKFKIKENEK